MSAWPSSALALFLFAIRAFPIKLGHIASHSVREIIFLGLEIREPPHRWGLSASTEASDVSPLLRGGGVLDVELNLEFFEHLVKSAQLVSIDIFEVLVTRVVLDAPKSR